VGDPEPGDLGGDNGDVIPAILGLRYLGISAAGFVNE
jgi:hypothetical protein